MILLLTLIPEMDLTELFYQAMNRFPAAAMLDSTTRVPMVYNVGNADWIRVLLKVDTDRKKGRIVVHDSLLHNGVQYARLYAELPLIARPISLRPGLSCDDIDESTPVSFERACNKARVQPVLFSWSNMCNALHVHSSLCTRKSSTLRRNVQQQQQDLRQLRPRRQRTSHQRQPFSPQLRTDERDDNNVTKYHRRCLSSQCR